MKQLYLSNSLSIIIDQIPTKYCVQHYYNDVTFVLTLIKHLKLTFVTVTASTRIRSRIIIKSLLHNKYNTNL